MTTSLSIEPTGEACGARVTGLDLRQPLEADTVAALREAWLAHHVLVFPEQPMDDDDLERFTLYFGPFGHDPFFGAIPGRENIAAICREPDETAPVFAEAFHSDWSFQPNPPPGTILRSLVIPPVGGDTLYANQHAAYAALPDAMRSRVDGLRAIHSARLPYSPGGIYGQEDASKRSMDIRVSEEAMAEYVHPLVLEHPETGHPALFSSIVYIMGFEGMPDDEARELLKELYAWQTREAFQYRHRWEEDMLVMWDNRSVLHSATGGYDGHARRLHRTTIGAA